MLIFREIYYILNICYVIKIEILIVLCTKTKNTHFSALRKKKKKKYAHVPT